jgi:transcriptional regulator with XRE-family HTH domain
LGIRGYTPTVEAAVSIAQTLGVSVEYLVTGKETEKERLLSTLPQDIQDPPMFYVKLNVYFFLKFAKNVA